MAERRGIGATVALTIVYWLSDLIVALSMGGLLAASLLFGRVNHALHGGAPSATIVLGARAGIGLIDQLRPFIVAAAIILVASVILTVMLERQARHSVGWWINWVIRSSAAIAMGAVALYALGDIDAHVTKLESDIAYMNAPLAAQSNGAEMGASDSTLDTQQQVKSLDLARSSVIESFQELHGRFRHWTVIELVFGAIVVLAAAAKQAVWRRSWLTHRELAQRARDLEAKFRSQPEKKEEPPPDDKGEAPAL